MQVLKCLVADAMHESLFPMLRKIGWHVDYEPSLNRGELKKRLPGYDGLIIRSKTIVDADLLGENPTIRFVGRAGAGIDNLDTNYLRSKGVEILHAADGNRDAVGEFAVGLLISLLRNIPRAHSEVVKFKWERERNRGEELMGKTVGVIGYGNMGKAFARRLSGFGCKILAYDKYKSRFSDEFCVEATMEQIIKETDVLSLHIPLTAETKAMVNSDYLKLFEKNIILLNTARGEIVVLKDLANAIKSGKVRGAALDVLENEKLDTLTEDQAQSFKYLSGKTNVIFTPHIAGWTFESHEKINVALVNKLKSLSFNKTK
jgi:D-3-phosphoglycerate dehydrogenase / 2-oxoglutarate reductase